MSFDEEDDAARWALPRAGNAGGISSSPAVSDPSSSDVGGDTSTISGTSREFDGRLLAAVVVSNENQLRK
jgi:hypothetical protein